ncbi:MAG: transcriptional regulator [Bacillota bacterium]|nr:transcriptional regulator [Bacillota bacterium]
MNTDRIFRIGEKMVSLEKASRIVEKALDLREQGYSQQESAKRLQLDRSFVSRLESVGEIRKGNRVAVIGFPLANRDTIADICRAAGLDFYLLMTNEERWDMVRDKQALDFFNRVLELVKRLREFDTLIMITSDKWRQLAEALLDIQIVYINLGSTPIQEDREVNLDLFNQTLDMVLNRDQERREIKTVETHCGD